MPGYANIPIDKLTQLKDKDSYAVIIGHYDPEGEPNYIGTDGLPIQNVVQLETKDNTMKAGQKADIVALGGKIIKEK